MALGQAGRPSARQVVVAWLAFAIACLAIAMTGAAVAAPGDYVGAFGPDGTTGTEFGRPAGLAVDQETGAVYVADSETQTLYKFDADGNPLDYGGAAGYITENRITGLSLNEGNPGTAEVAVDPETHVVYVTSGNNVRAFEADGEPHNFTEGANAGTSELSGATELYGVTVDKYGTIYASDFGDKKVRIYSRGGALITDFEPSRPLSPLRPGTIAVAPDGTLYVTGFETDVYALEPSSFPVTTGTTYGLGQAVNSHLSVTVAVDPKTQYVYISELCPVGVCDVRVSVYDELGNSIGTIGAEGDGVLEGFPAGLSVNGERKELYGAVRGEGPTALSQVAIYDIFAFIVDRPTITNVSATSVTSTSAVLQARINPNTLGTAYQFEYGLEDCAAVPGSCTKVPASPVTIGSGHNPVAVSANVAGLTPGTRYFFRVVAENSEGVAEAPSDTSRSFVTQIGHFGSLLSDERVWEMVTPPKKFGAVVMNNAILQANPDGSGIAFHTRGSIVEDPEGNRSAEPSAVLARRGGSGWSVEDLVPPRTEAGNVGFGPEFKLFSSDLGQALLEPRDETPLSPEFSERAPTLRTNTIPPSYRPLVTSKEPYANVPESTVFGGEANGARNPVAISGANRSLTHVALSSEPALVSEAQKRSLYHWSDGALEGVSELPAEDGGEPGKFVTAQLGSGVLSVRNAVSEDGSKIFWGPGDQLASHLNWPGLYMRDTVADETVRIDKAEAGATEAGAVEPAFMTASVDGSVVFFTDSQQLTADASPSGRDLYRCEVGDVGGSLGCGDLEDLSAPLAGSGESGEAEALAVGISDDGKSLYFVADGILDSKPGASGGSAVSGSPNLYLWREGLGVRFIAPLSKNDSPDWGVTLTGEVSQGSKAVGTSSPDGRYLVFMSEQSLAGAETTDPKTGEPVEQTFLYDSTEDQLVCTSCNPNGSTDPGHRMPVGVSEGGVISPDAQRLWPGRLVGATLPETTEDEVTAGFALYWPRAVLDNGRAYFNSIAPLVTGDSNGTWDVYQYEPLGVGDCDPSAGSGMVATTETGCIALMSSGTASLPSVFMDASASGDDVFLATFGRLSALDTDDIVDVYDARVDGVEAVVGTPTECAGEACQPSGSPPGDSAPNSSTFNGSGNLHQKPRKHCKKGQRKVKRHGKTKCVKAKKHKKQGQNARTKGRA